MTIPDTHTLEDGVERPVWNIRLAGLPVLRKLCGALDIDLSFMDGKSARHLRYTIIGLLRDRGAVCIVVQYSYRTKEWTHHLLGKYRNGTRPVLCSITDSRGIRPEASVTR